MVALFLSIVHCHVPLGTSAMNVVSNFKNMSWQSEHSRVRMCSYLSSIFLSVHEYYDSGMLSGHYAISPLQSYPVFIFTMQQLPLGFYGVFNFDSKWKIAQATSNIINSVCLFWLHYRYYRVCLEKETSFNPVAQLTGPVIWEETCR